MNKTAKYVVKISAQGQITLPKALRLQLGVNKLSRVVLQPVSNGVIRVENKLPVEQFFGTMPNVWTDGKDAATIIRQQRDKQNQKMLQSRS